MFIIMMVVVVGAVGRLGESIACAFIRGVADFAGPFWSF